MLRLKLAELPSPTDGMKTGKKKQKKKHTLFIGKLHCLIVQKLWRAANKQLIHVSLSEELEI